MTFKLELEKVVGDFGSTLAREDEHLVPAHSDREVTAGWGNLAALLDLHRSSLRYLVETLYYTILD